MNVDLPVIDLARAPAAIGAAARVSTPHPVVNRAGRERSLLAFVSDPNGDAPVSCLPTPTGPHRPPRYPPITAAAYVRDRLDATCAFRRATPTGS